MLFEWDDDKNKYNKAVHKIDFETAALVLQMNTESFCVMKNTVNMRTGIKQSVP